MTQRLAVVALLPLAMACGARAGLLDAAPANDAGRSGQGRDEAGSGGNATAGGSAVDDAGPPVFPAGVYGECTYTIAEPEGDAGVAATLAGGPPGFAMTSVTVTEAGGIVSLALGVDGGVDGVLQGTVDFTATTDASAVLLPGQNCVVGSIKCELPEPGGGPGLPLGPMVVTSGSLALDGDALTASLVGTVCTLHPTRVTLTCVKE